jgi:hypothetical protein
VAAPRAALAAVQYIDEHGVTQTAPSVTVLTTGTTTLSAGWYVAQGTLNYTPRITVNGVASMASATVSPFPAPPAPAPGVPPLPYIPAVSVDLKPDALTLIAAGATPDLLTFWAARRCWHCFQYW